MSTSKKKKINQFNSWGNRVGYWESYWVEGKVFAKGNFKNGKANGSWKWYYYSGKLESKSNYINGEQYGWWYKYDKEGKLIKEYFIVNL